MRLFDDGTTDPRFELVRDRIAECESANKAQLERGNLAYVVIHRTDLSRKGPDNPDPVSDLMLDGPELARRFKNRLLGTGGLTPYHFLVLVDGSVEQILPLGIQGAHAPGYNWRSVAVAVVGSDLEHRAPLHSQVDRLIRLVALLRGLNGGLRVEGHTALPGASHDPNKVCPGPFLVPAEIEAQANVFLPGGVAGSDAHVDYVLGQAGIVL